jgi:cobalt-zinc-cadmium efflux system membrane fusion protein
MSEPVQPRPASVRGPFASILLEWIPNSFVLAVLLGIAFMGHLTHWKLPKFEDVMSGKLFAGHGAHDDEAHAVAPISTNFVELTEKQAKLRSELEFAKVERRPLRESITANGRIVYDQTRLAQLSPRSSGVVWRVEKRAGQLVNAGDVLAIVDSREVGDAKAEYLSALAEYEHRLSTKSRLESAGEGISQKLLLEAATELKKGRIRKMNAFQSLVNLGLVRADISEDTFTSMNDGDRAVRVKRLGLTPELIQEFGDRPISGNLIPLVAPFAGVVVGRDIVVGELATPERAAMTVADITKMWIELGVRREDASVLRLGQEVKFTAVGLPPELPSTLTWISTELDEATHTLTVRAEIENPMVGDAVKGSQQLQRMLAANTFGRGDICVRRQSDALMAPSTALHHDGKQIIVFVPGTTPGTFESRPVSVGISEQGWTEIVSGLNEGDLVVTNGSMVLKAEVARRRADQGEDAPQTSADKRTDKGTQAQPVSEAALKVSTGAVTSL